MMYGVLISSKKKGGKLKGFKYKDFYSLFKKFSQYNPFWGLEISNFPLFFRLSRTFKI